MKLILGILILSMTLSASGQEFSGFLQMNREPVDPAKLKKVYDHFTGSEFSEIAHDLAKRVGENPVLQGSIPQDKQSKPWTHSLGLTLANAWRFHTNYAARKEPLGKVFDVLMSVLQDDAVGAGRRIALGEISTRLYWGRLPGTHDKSLPPLQDTISRLSAIALDPEEDVALRKALVPVLFEHGDPNEYLDLAIEITSGEKDSLAIAEAFRFATPVRYCERLTKENRAKYLNHAFKLLQRINDKKSGTGYFLASHIGSFVGVQPVRPGQGAFAPDQRLDEYQGKNGLTEAFFQKTVDNAMDWWTNNKGKY